MHVPTHLGALGAAAVLSLSLAACGGADATAGASSGSTPSSSGASPSASAPAPTDARHDAADVSFAQDMTVHHRGAVEMARLAATRASSPQVEDLASRIEAAQGPEIDEMTGWLTTWGEPAPGGMSGMDHSSGSMGMSGEQMAQLTTATGPAFDRLFLQLMTSHHQGAIAMARTEQADGANPQAIALARSIEASQSAEVTGMGQLLTALGS